MSPNSPSSNPSRALAAEYSAAAAEYALHWAPVIGPMARPILDDLPLSNASRVLDLGCGTGQLLRDLQARAPAARLFGVDRSAGMVGAAPRDGDAALAVMSADRLALRPESIDIVILAFMLFHLPDAAAGLREVRRVLRPRGRAGIVVWGRDQTLPGFDIWQEELDAAGAAADPRDPAVMRHDAMDDTGKLTALLAQAGFADVRARTERHLYRWTPRSLLALQTACGGPSRRLASLSAQAQASCRARVLARFSALALEAFVYRPEVVYATASARG